MVSLQRTAIWGEGIATWAGQLLLLIGFGLWCVWMDHIARTSALTSLFSNTPPASTEQLRSRYEQQIRDAARQEERNRLARDLHDSIKQQIFVIQTAAATVQARFDEDRSGARAAVEQIRAAARDAAAEMQTLLDQLRAEPLGNAGLIEAVKRQCEALSLRTGAQVDFRPGDLPPAESMPPGAHDAILRVAQEALANVGRHARAKTVRVSLDSLQHVITLTVADDGSGFDPNQPPSGQGLANMHARAEEIGATLDLVSRPGGGTSITLSLPFVEMSTARQYMHKIILWSGAIVIAPVLFFLTARDPSTLATMSTIICSFAILQNVSAYRRVRSRQAR